MAAALPDLARARSLVLTAMRRPRGAGPVFLTPRGGMGTLVDRLVDALGAEDLRTACPALSLAPDGDGFAVETPDGAIPADAVLVATPATAAARLLAPVAPDAAEPLAAIRHRGTAVVHLRYAPGTLGQPLDGSGYLVAPEEEVVTAACTWIGAKWPHLSAGGLRLRAAASAPHALALSDEVLRDRVVAEVERVMRATRPPEDARLLRWPEVLPVYAPGHLQRIAAARRGLPARVALAGAAYEGVGVPDCIRTGEDAAARLVASLAA